MDRLFQVGDLVTGRFPDHTDRYEGGSPKWKEEIGIVTGVFIEKGSGTYRLSLIIRGEEKWAFDYSLTLVEAA